MAKKKINHAQNKKDLYAELLMYIVDYYKVPYPSDLKVILSKRKTDNASILPGTFLYVCSVLSDQTYEEILSLYFDASTAITKSDTWEWFIRRNPMVKKDGEKIIRNIQEKIVYDTISKFM
jgi:hypothetical protein